MVKMEQNGRRISIEIQVGCKTLRFFAWKNVSAVRCLPIHSPIHEVTTGSDCYFVIERMQTRAITFNYRLIASGTRMAAHLSLIVGILMHRHDGAM